jgi:hypothetical protein
MSLDIPRLQFYDGETFSRLVMADTSGLVGTIPRRVFGASKVNLCAKIRNKVILSDITNGR